MLAVRRMLAISPGKPSPLDNRRASSGNSSSSLALIEGCRSFIGDGQEHELLSVVRRLDVIALLDGILDVGIPNSAAKKKPLQFGSRWLLAADFVEECEHGRIH